MALLTKIDNVKRSILPVSGQFLMGRLRGHELNLILNEQWENSSVYCTVPLFLRLKMVGSTVR